MFKVSKKLSFLKQGLLKILLTGGKERALACDKKEAEREGFSGMGTIKIKMDKKKN